MTDLEKEAQNKAIIDLSIALEEIYIAFLVFSHKESPKTIVHHTAAIRARDCYKRNKEAIEAARRECE